MLATVGFATTSLVQGVAFYLVLRGLGRRPQLAGCLVVWTRSFLARYAPSGALALVVRLRETRRLDADRPLIVSASGFEQLIALVSGPFVALAGFLVARSGTPWPVWALCGASLVGLALAAPRIGGRRLAHLIEARFRVPPTLLRGRVLVAPRYGLGAATTLVLGMRLVATFGELTAIAAGEAVGLAARRRRRRCPARATVATWPRRTSAVVTIGARAA